MAKGLGKFLDGHAVGCEILDHHGVVAHRIQSEIVPEAAVARAALRGEDARARIGRPARVAPVAQERARAELSCAIGRGRPDNSSADDDQIENP